MTHSPWLGSHFPAISWPYRRGVVTWLSAHSQPFSPFQTAAAAAPRIQGDCPEILLHLVHLCPLFLKVLPACLQMLPSNLKEDMELGVGAGILGRKVNLAALTEVDGEWGRVNGHLSETCGLTTCRM